MKPASRKRGRARAAGASLAALAGALAIAPCSAGAAAAVGGAEGAVTGVAPRVAAIPAGPAAPRHPRPRGARRAPGWPGARARAGEPAGAPAGTAAPPASEAAPLPPAPALLQNFNGVSSRDSQATNFGEEVEPPDQGLCAGNGFVVEMVNSAYAIYRSDGSVAAGPFNVNGPFNEGLSEFVSDPRCYFDPSTNTWFAIIVFINGESTASHVDVAVNTSGDPTTEWSDYRIDTTDIGGATGPRHPGCPCLGDQPKLGIDSHNLYVSTDEFSILGPRFNGSQIYAIDKKDLVSLQPSARFAHLENLKLGGRPALSVQPALSSGSPAAEFFLSSLDPNATSERRIGVWALTRAAAVASGGTPTLSSVIVATETYGVPPGAKQKGAASLLESGDARMQQVQYAGGSVWGELGTAITISGDSAQRAGAAWFQVQPSLAAGTLAGATVRGQGYVSLLGNYLLYPALAVTPSGAAAMVVTVSGKALFPSAGYATLSPGSGSFGPVSVAAPGAGSYDRGGERWGDYSWAVADPAGASVWLATEYVPPKPSQTTNGLGNWGTRVLQVPTG